MDRQQPDPLTINSVVDEALSKVDWTNREPLDIIVTIEMKPVSLSLTEVASKYMDRPRHNLSDGSACKYAGTLTSQDIQDIKKMEAMPWVKTLKS